MPNVLTEIPKYMKILPGNKKALADVRTAAPEADVTGPTTDSRFFGWSAFLNTVL